jgi:hypothetical protein
MCHGREVERLRRKRKSVELESAQPLNLSTAKKTGRRK